MFFSGTRTKSYRTKTISLFYISINNLSVKITQISVLLINVVSAYIFIFSCQDTGFLRGFFMKFGDKKLHKIRDRSPPTKVRWS